MIMMTGVIGVGRMTARMTTKRRRVMILTKCKVWYEATKLESIVQIGDEEIKDTQGFYNYYDDSTGRTKTIRVLESHCGHHHQTPSQAEMCAKRINGKVMFVRGSSMYDREHICDAFYDGIQHKDFIALEYTNQD